MHTHPSPKPLKRPRSSSPLTSMFTVHTLPSELHQAVTVTPSSPDTKRPKHHNHNGLTTTVPSQSTAMATAATTTTTAATTTTRTPVSPFAPGQSTFITSHSLTPPTPLSQRETLCVLPAATVCRLFDPESVATDNSHLLFDTPAGDIQRHLDPEHLHELVHYQQTCLQTYHQCSFPTALVVAEFEGRVALVDGQHRVETMRHLYRTGSLTDAQWAALRMVVTVVHLNAPGEYDDVFVAVNKNKPVQLYSNVDAWKSVLKGVEQHFRVHYGAYIRETSDHPRVPHINVRNLLRYLDQGDYVRKLGLSCEAFITELESLNTCYRLHWRQLIPKKYITEIAAWAPKCIAKQPERPLMLGLYQSFEWVDRILLKVTYPETYPSYETMTHVKRNPRIRIPKATKQLVWKKRNPAEVGLEGKCYVCDRPLNYDDMQCGHVVSVFAGGATVLSNLEPICGCCNRDMGIEELEGYRGRVRGGGG